MTPYSLIWLFFSQSVISVEQQVVVHWASETLSESSDLLKDRDGSLLDSGSTSNGDGVVVTLGILDTATSDHPFNGNWVPLTDGTRVGDSSSGYGYSDGTFSFTTVFTKNSMMY